MSFSKNAAKAITSAPTHYELFNNLVKQAEDTEVDEDIKERIKKRKQMALLGSIVGLGGVGALAALALGTETGRGALDATGKKFQDVTTGTESEGTFTSEHIAAPAATALLRGGIPALAATYGLQTGNDYRARLAHTLGRSNSKLRQNLGKVVGFGLDADRGKPGETFRRLALKAQSDATSKGVPRWLMRQFWSGPRSDLYGFFNQMQSFGEGKKQTTLNNAQIAHNTNAINAVADYLNTKPRFSDTPRLFSGRESSLSEAYRELSSMANSKKNLFDKTLGGSGTPFYAKGRGSVGNSFARQNAVDMLAAYNKRRTSRPWRTIDRIRSPTGVLAFLGGNTVLPAMLASD